MQWQGFAEPAGGSLVKGRRKEAGPGFGGRRSVLLSFQEMTLLLLTHNFTGFMVVELLVPVEQSEAGEGG